MEPATIFLAGKGFSGVKATNLGSCLLYCAYQYHKMYVAVKWCLQYFFGRGATNKLGASALQAPFAICLLLLYTAV